MLKRPNRATAEPGQTERASLHELSDADLVQRVLVGKREAFRFLVERYRQSVYNLAYSILGSREDAQDIAQEAFLAAYRRLPELRDWDKFGSWLFGTTRHLCYVLLRRRRVLGGQVPIEGADTLAAEARESTEEDHMTMMLEAMGGLPDKYQVLLRLKYLGGYSYKVIAEMMDLPEITVKSRLFEARRMLRERVALLVRKYDGS
jgi:RNA polymerase sigma-70 factor (ECF subfamily)